MNVRLKTLGALTALVAIFASCRFNPGAGTDFCVEDIDCTRDRVCVAQQCVTPGSNNIDRDSGIDTDRPDMKPTLCGIDGDNDGFAIGPNCPPDQLDCNDEDDKIYPGASLRCNGEDNDCDGNPDAGDCECIDGSSEVCGSDTGLCVKGMRTCVDGTWGDCEGEIGPKPETCDNEDNNCDGTADEGCPCSQGETEACGSDIGTCSPGTKICVQGSWSNCQGGQGPVPETCNGQDDDCNDVIDDVAGLGAICVTGQPGICASGMTVCKAGNVLCEPINPSEIETCNNRDDDCDGDIDNGVRMACNTACGVGTETCSMGGFGDCIPDNPPEEICNGVDDDCDNDIDESFPESNDPCTTALPGVCTAGTYACPASGVLTCEPDIAPSAELCNGEDDDCDGLVDEDQNDLVLKQPCGFCPTGGVELCIGGVYSGCDYNDVEICDGSDRNCDTLADNSSACYRVCGNEIIMGTQSCNGGATLCELPNEICGDNIDNNCDGQIDLNCDSAVEDMVFVPGGTFIMGSDPIADPDSQSDEYPQHTVSLSPFYIDKYEVTRANYGGCVTAGQCGLLTAGCPLQLTQTDKPIVCVTEAQAAAYCSWRSKRLPTEAEWEKAARGPFSRTTIYPYGDVGNNGSGRYDCVGSANQCSVSVTTYQSGESYYGARNMSGNAGEIVSDFYDANFYSSNLATNPENTNDGGLGLVVRGGTYALAIEFGRLSNRGASGATGFNVPNDTVGFRCAKDF